MDQLLPLAYSKINLSSIDGIFDEYSISPKGKPGEIN